MYFYLYVCYILCIKNNKVKKNIIIIDKELLKNYTFQNVNKYKMYTMFVECKMYTLIKYNIKTL